MKTKFTMMMAVIATFAISLKLHSSNAVSYTHLTLAHYITAHQT